MKRNNVGAYVRSLAVSAGIIVSIMAFSSPVIAATQWDMGISGGDDGIDGFHLSVGDYYRVPQREVTVIHERGICDEELPVVFYLAQRAHVHPQSIVRLRHRGMSWMDITLHFGLSPDIYYVPVRHYHHHGKAYGHYRDCSRKNWKRRHFSDGDIVNQVNLRFMSEHHGYAPEKVMRYRSEGRRFTDIHRDIHRERHGRVAYNDRRDRYQGKDSDHDEEMRGNANERNGQGNGRKRDKD